MIFRIIKKLIIRNYFLLPDIGEFITKDKKKLSGQTANLWLMDFFLLTKNINLFIKFINFYIKLPLGKKQKKIEISQQNRFNNLIRDYYSNFFHDLIKEDVILHGLIDQRFININYLNDIFKKQITSLKKSKPIRIKKKFDFHYELNEHETRILDKFIFNDTDYVEYKNHFKIRKCIIHYANKETKEYEEYCKEFSVSNDLSGFHFDPKVDYKMIIYLNNVAKKNGAFSYIKNFNFQNLSLSQNLISRVIGSKFYLNCNLERDFLRKLPNRLRVTSNLGFLIDKSKDDAINKAFNNIEYLDSSKGNAILFNSGKLIHRGARVLSGERISMQLILTKKI